MSWCNACESNPCSCTKASVAVMSRHTYVPQQHGITKEQFGLTLYDTIQTISGIRALEEHIAVAIYQNKGHKLQDLKARRLDLKDHLANLLPKLTEDEMERVLAAYPYAVDM